MIHGRRWGRTGRATADSATPATTYAISKSPSGRPRSRPPMPGWAAPSGRAHLSAPLRVLVKGSWSSRRPRRVAAAAVAAISPRLAHQPGRSRISREYSQGGHLLKNCIIIPPFRFRKQIKLKQYGDIFINFFPSFIFLP